MSLFRQTVSTAHIAHILTVSFQQWKPNQYESEMQHGESTSLDSVENVYHETNKMQKLEFKYSENFNKGFVCVL